MVVLEEISRESPNRGGQQLNIIWPRFLRRCIVTNLFIPLIGVLTLPCWVSYFWLHMIGITRVLFLLVASLILIRLFSFPVLSLHPLRLPFRIGILRLGACVVVVRRGVLIICSTSFLIMALLVMVVCPNLNILPQAWSAFLDAPRVLVTMDIV